MSSKANYQNYNFRKSWRNEKTVSLLKKVTIFIGYRKQNLNPWFQRLATEVKQNGTKENYEQLYFRHYFGMKNNLLKNDTNFNCFNFVRTRKN